MTSGGLTRDQLAISAKSGKIVSKKKQQQNRKKSNLGNFLAKKKTIIKRFERVLMFESWAQDLTGNATTHVHDDYAL